MEENPEQMPRNIPAREDRVAAALRENLRKRKQQANSRGVKSDDCGTKFGQSGVSFPADLIKD
jgi:hypothetical protein